MTDNKKIKTTESLQIRFQNGVKTCNRNQETNTSSFFGKEKNKIGKNNCFLSFSAVIVGDSGAYAECDIYFLKMFCLKK